MARLILYEGLGVREFEIMDDVIRIGRELDNNLRIPDPSVSRIHAILRRSPTGYVLQDQKSVNGITFQEKKVDEITLSHGDVFFLGQIRLTFQDFDEVGGYPATNSDSSKNMTHGAPIKLSAGNANIASGDNSASDNNSNRNIISKILARVRFWR